MFGICEFRVKLRFTQYRRKIRSPGGAVGESNLSTNMCHIDNSTGSGVLSSVDNELECNFNLVGDVLAANLIFAEAEGAALSSAGRAGSPADGTNTGGVVLTFRVA